MPYNGGSCCVSITEKRAREAGATVIQATRDFPHGWRDVMLADPDGYIWAVGVPIRKTG